jgi:hypothetical protein
LAGGYDSLHEALTLTPADDDAQFGA